MPVYLIIFGTRGIHTRSGGGSFNCPECRASRSYTHHRVRRFFTLYFIPVIPLDLIGEYVECDMCVGTFHPDVRNYAPQLQQAEPDRKFEAEFMVAIKRVMVMMCLADGVVDDEEIETIKQVYGRIAKRPISDEEVSNEIVEAMQSKDTVGDFLGAVAPRLNDAGKEMVIKAAFFVAAADGEFQDEEQELLAEIGQALELRPGHVNRILDELLSDDDDE